MTPDTTISISLLLSLGSIIFVVLNYRRLSKKDTQDRQLIVEKDERDRELRLKAEIEEKVKMNVKLDQLCNTTNDIRADNKSVLERLNIMDARLVKVEQSTKSAHHRIDEHLKNEDREEVE